VSDPAGGNETILLVEDDPHVRSTVAKLLAGLGYAVEQAETGDEALALSVARSQPFDLVLTDLVMPGIDGVAMAARITELHPGARFLFSSGYAEHEVFSSMAPDAHFLPKPFTGEQLARAVREALTTPR
jgi:CheY-like chemotaxis protein